MIVAMSGHRPEKISDPDDVLTSILVGWTVVQPSLIIQGMASGVDLWSAQLAHGRGIPFWCARPWDGHKPRKDDAVNYAKAMTHAAYVHVVTPYVVYPGPWVYQKRNEWMVDKADTLFAVWDGSSGGTANCVEYALKQDKRVLRYDPKERKLDWYK